jgi:signal transduction histidine kinase
MRHNLAPDEIFDLYFLQSVVQHATYLLNVEGSCFYFWDAVVQQATLMAKYNLPSIPWEDSLPGRTILSQKALIETFPSRPALLAVPVALHEDSLGVLVVADWAPRRLFNERDVATLQSLADLAAAASRQSQRLARMTAQFRALHVIDLALTSSLEPDRVLSLILEKAVELIGAEHGSLRELKQDTGELILKAHFGDKWTEEALAYTPRVGEGIMQWVAKHRLPYLSPDVRKDPRYVVLFEDMRSSLAVPLLTNPEGEPDEDDFLGVVLLESSRLAAFDHQDVELMDALAQEAVISIQNARQHQRLQSMHRRLTSEQERRLAAEKWTVMGQAATSLAHRINNLIGIVPASADEIQRSLKGVDLGDGDRIWVEANINRIQRNARFILKLSDALFRPFKEAGPSGYFNVNRLLKEALEFADLPAHLQVVCDYDPKLPDLESSPLLVDIFLELITNAKKAMEGGELQLLTLKTRFEAAAEGAVVVSIQDSGRGFSPEQLAHMWDMFQQSRDGLGFGLWWIRTFIERQGGTIDCTSTPGSGAVFTLRLPVHPSPGAGLTSLGIEDRLEHAR